MNHSKYLIFLYGQILLVFAFMWVIVFKPTSRTDEIAMILAFSEIAGLVLSCIIFKFGTIILSQHKWILFGQIPFSVSLLWILIDPPTSRLIEIISILISAEILGIVAALFLTKWKRFGLAHIFDTIITISSDARDLIINIPLLLKRNRFLLGQMLITLATIWFFFPDLFFFVCVIETISVLSIITAKLIVERRTKIQIQTRILARGVFEGLILDATLTILLYVICGFTFGFYDMGTIALTISAMILLLPASLIFAIYYIFKRTGPE